MTIGVKTRPLRVACIRYQARGVISVELVDPDGNELPGFTAGSHVDLVLGNGQVRSYSLANDPTERHRYVVGVHRAPESRGGSLWIHDELRVGGLVEVSDPTNNFELDESAPAVLVAGGIGITPMLAMIRRLERLDRRWQLHYAVRETELAAFLPELTELDGGWGRVSLHVDAEADGAPLDLAAVVAATDDDAHLYCCGPAGMLAAFQAATAELDQARCHVEHFSNDAAPDTSGGFEVVLEQTGLTVTVESGQTILTALQDAGADLAYSCSEGICGTCELRVLSGVPDHRDLVLTESEKQANDVMMICCSGSKTPRLVLDA